MKLVVFLISFILTSTAFAQSMMSPTWFQRDVVRGAAWLPTSIRKLGLDEAYRQRWEALPSNVQAVLLQMNIPPWQIALIPTDASSQFEIIKQLSAINDLSGPAPQGVLSKRAEQLLIFGGAAQLPTPGEATTGASLGPEGCTAAMAKYILAQLKLEFPQMLANLPDKLATTQSSVEMKNLFMQLAQSGATWFDIRHYPFAQLQAQSVQPGNLMIGQKPGGTHVFAWTRVLSFWRWSPTAKMAIGNTGLPQFGNRLILAQEYLTEDPSEYDVNAHNQHGPLNSTNMIRGVDGRPVLSDPRTNVYAAQGSDFIVINLH